MDELTCATCGTDDHLRGEPEGSGIVITCGGCDATWRRDLTPRCPTCGDDDLLAEKLPVIDKSRGSQLSIVGLTTRYLCRTCDRHEIDRQWRHIPPGSHPAK